MDAESSESQLSQVSDEVFQPSTIESQERAIMETEEAIIQMKDILARKMAKCRSQQRELNDENKNEMERKIDDLKRLVKTNERRIARNHRYTVGNFNRYVGPSPDQRDAGTQTCADNNAIQEISDQMDRRSQATIVQDLWHVMGQQRYSDENEESNHRIN